MTTLAPVRPGTDADAAPDGAAPSGPVVAVVRRAAVAATVARGASTARPRPTGSSRAVRRDLALRALIVVYAGWVAFLAVLLQGRLAAVAAAVAALPRPAAVAVWLVGLPWTVGTAIWEGPWPAAVRVATVAVFAIAWCSLARTLAIAFVLRDEPRRS